MRSLWLIFLCAGFAWGGSVPWEAEGELASGNNSQRTVEFPWLAQFQGSPFVLEVSDAKSFGKALPRLPKGWGFLQADENTLVNFQLLFAGKQLPCLASFDEFGNCVLIDGSRGGRRQSSLRDFFKKHQSRIKKIQDSLGQHWKDVKRLQQRKKTSRELVKLLEIRNSQGANGRQIVGYPIVVKARQRILELENLRLQELYQLLALEGKLPYRKLLPRLEALEGQSRGLEVEQRIRKLRKRFEAGYVIQQQP